MSRRAVTRHLTAGLVVLMSATCDSVSQPSQPSVVALAVTTNSLAYTLFAGTDSATQSFTITSTTPGVRWNAATGVSWLVLSPTSGVAPGTVTVRARSEGLSAGNHSAIISITTPSAMSVSQAVLVSLAVNPRPTLTLGTASINFAGVLIALAEKANVTVAVDSREALAGVQSALRGTKTRVDIMVEVDAGMHRVGATTTADAVAVASAIENSPNTRYAGLLFYPGHIREPVNEQKYVIATTRALLNEFVSALFEAELAPPRVSGGSTPTAYASHLFDVVNEIRPGTYIFNDRTTAQMGACDWTDCAYTVMATVVSTSVAGQAVVDAGSKALFREELRGTSANGFGALVDRPDVIVKNMSEEHGLLDIAKSDWRPRVGDRVRIVPNHVCVSVNLHERLWMARGDEIVDCFEIQARGW